jgi:bifunctional non-homologous end joining protein LigD
VKSIKIEEKSGSTSPYLVIASGKGLIAATQIGALEFHIWGACADRIERPERIVFDLDPDPSVAFRDVREAAREIKAVLEAADLTSFALLTGGKGIHVVVPIERRRDWTDIKTFSRGLARKLADAAPDTYVAEARKSKRKGRIFIDWLRNQRGATAIAPYSLRARQGAPVATPISWRELDSIESAAQFTLDTIGPRLASLAGDPWQDYGRVRQSITNDHLRFIAET